MLVEISGMDDSNKFSRWFTFWGILGHKSVHDFSLIYAIHLHFPGYVLDLPKLIVYDNCFQLAKKKATG